jgi:hypothetical protein
VQILGSHSGMIRIEVIWVMTPCSLVDVSQCFGWTHHHHFQRFNPENGGAKRWYLYKRLQHGVIPRRLNKLEKDHGTSTTHSKKKIYIFTEMLLELQEKSPSW